MTIVWKIIIAVLTWMFGQLFSFIQGVNYEHNKRLKKELENVKEANNIRNNLKSNPSYVAKLREKYTRK